MNKLNVIVVDDEQGYRDEISEYLSDCGFAVNTAEKPSQALAMVSTQTVDIAILDLKLPEMNGITLMKKLLSIDPEIAVIIISGHGDMESVIEAMREGALDFFPKPFDLTDIQFSIERTQKYLALQQKVTSFKETCNTLLEASEKNSRYQIIGNSSLMHRVIEQMKQVANTPNTDVLITGESGTGKELVARGIHRLSNRKEQIFFDVNCTAITENLFESEFFGHNKNAFTGAAKKRKGWFEISDRGTLFLDEIGDMPLFMQAKLLRVLEERKIRRVGSNQDIPLDLRLIVSTNKNLEKLVKKKLFRKDLYYRLNKFRIHLPPLRERKEDIPLLLDHFTRLFCLAMKKNLKVVRSDTLDKLQKYDFPGNIRELKNLVEKAVIISQPNDKYLKLNIDLDQIENADFHEFTDLSNLALSQLEKLEEKMIRKALQKTGNNKTKAAGLLQITRTSLNRRIKKYNLDY